MWESTGGSIPPSSRRVRAKRSREGVPAFCMITFCTIHIRNIGRYEWASVVCRKPHVVQSLCPYIHGVSSLVETLYGIWILARVIGQSPFPRGSYEWPSVVCRKAQVVQSLPLTGRDPLRYVDIGQSPFP